MRTGISLSITESILRGTPLDGYSVNGLLSVLVIGPENNLQNPCGQYEVNGLSPDFAADFAQGQYYQKDCAA